MFPEIMQRVLYNGRMVQDTARNNATSTATVPTPGTTFTNQSRVIILGVAGQYSAAVATVQNLTLSYIDPNGTSRTITFPSTYSAASVTFALPAPISTQVGSLPSVVLDASGTGGVTGQATLYYAFI